MERGKSDGRKGFQPVFTYHVPYRPANLYRRGGIAESFGRKARVHSRIQAIQDILLPILAGFGLSLLWVMGAE